MDLWLCGQRLCGRPFLSVLLSFSSVSLYDSRRRCRPRHISPSCTSPALLCIAHVPPCSAASRTAASCLPSAAVPAARREPHCVPSPAQGSCARRDQPRLPSPSAEGAAHGIEESGAPTRGGLQQGGTGTCKHFIHLYLCCSLGIGHLLCRISFQGWPLESLPIESNAVIPSV
ncbi:hypothetical protein NDU88_004078 [Pleurodeles waltl]|uniref:Uncharacterized protein n=1 Tax=Pleurodeles waltl TaxID=8319 RepID=A0AAV7VJ88_PLEWA|nr:hypothetical protein NDU88_004078 [Pleurodeles waltl]